MKNIDNALLDLKFIRININLKPFKSFNKIYLNLTIIKRLLLVKIKKF